LIITSILNVVKIKIDMAKLEESMMETKRFTLPRDSLDRLSGNKKKNKKTTFHILKK
jgi:hypothetical protein